MCNKYITTVMLYYYLLMGLRFQRVFVVYHCRIYKNHWSFNLIFLRLFLLYSITIMLSCYQYFLYCDIIGRFSEPKTRFNLPSFFSNMKCNKSVMWQLLSEIPLICILAFAFAAVQCLCCTVVFFMVDVFHRVLSVTMIYDYWTVSFYCCLYLRACICPCHQHITLYVKLSIDLHLFFYC